MTTAPQDLDALRNELATIETRLAIEDAKVNLHELERMAEYGRVVLWETGWGERLDPLEYLQDDPTFGRFTSPISRADDRTEGRYRPVFETESDLQMIRGAAHVMTTGFDAAINILTNLTNYTIASGFTHEVKPAEDAPDELPTGLVTTAQKVLDTFFDDNDWQADLEAEIHWRSREDGESPLVLIPRGWQTEVQLLEPDWIVQPYDSRDLEEWLDYMGADIAGEQVWHLGVHATSRRTSRPLGYHCVFDGAGSDWSYYPAEDVPLAIRLRTGVLELVKRNVPRNVVRGLSDFYPVLQRLERMHKLSINVETTAAIQAAIAFIREHLPTKTSGQISDLRSANKTETYQKRLPDGTQRTTYRQKYTPGTVIDTNGTKYTHGPMGQSSAPQYLDVIQSALRLTGSRWSMPEYMISADASNSNYSSTLIAGSPFVQCREADQRFYASRFHRIDWKVLRIAYEGGRFSGFAVSWEQLEAMLDVDVTPPDITIANKREDADIKAIEHAAGVLSVRTWIKESGRDVDEELKNIASEPKPSLSPLPVSPAGSTPALAPGAAYPARPGATGGVATRETLISNVLETMLQSADTPEDVRSLVSDALVTGGEC